MQINMDWLDLRVQDDFVFFTLFIAALQLAGRLVVYTFFVMQNYLTDVWKLSFTHAAAILNIWGGMLRIFPLVFLFLADTILGNFMMLAISTAAYSVGICFVTMSTPPVLANSTGTCKHYEPECIGHTQKLIFYAGMALIAVGIAGQQASLWPFRDEQQNDQRTNEHVLYIILLGTIFVSTPVIAIFVFPYVRQWSVLFGVSAICMVLASLFFFSGCCTYRKVKPQGSPVTDVCRVFVAAAFKISQPFPAYTKQLYKKDDLQGLYSFPPPPFLRGLEKAAIILPDVKLEDQIKSRWRLCSLDEVEAAKIAVRMVPMWSTFIICAFVSSIGDTYFVEQGSHMSRKLGKWQVPSQALLALYFLGKLCFELLAIHFLEKSSSKYGPSIGIGLSMALSILCCITAAGIEMWRLRVIKSNGLVDKPEENIPMSAFWLFFQFFLLSGQDSLLQESVIAFYDNEFPAAMRRYHEFFAKGVSGLGYMFSVLSVYIVGKISEVGGKPNWFQYTSNKSHLDRYYWVLASLNTVNLLVFVLVASRYQYKNRNEETRRIHDINGIGSDQPTLDGHKKSRAQFNRAKSI